LIEASVCRFLQHRSQIPCGNRRVGQNESQHRGVFAFESGFCCALGGLRGNGFSRERHLRMNHAGAFGTAPDAYRLAADFKKRGCDFECGVGCENRLRRFLERHDVQSVGAQKSFGQQRNFFCEQIHGHEVANDAGGGDENLIFGHIERFRRPLNGFFGFLNAAFAGAAVGATGVDHDHLGFAVLEVILVDRNMNAFHLVSSEARRRLSRFFGIEKGEAVSAGTRAVAPRESCRAKTFGELAHFNPSVSGSPNMMFIFWIACPEAPLTRLSVTAVTMAVVPDRSTETPIWQ